MESTSLTHRSIAVRNHSGKDTAYYLIGCLNVDPVETTAATSSPHVSQQPSYCIVYQSSLLVPAPHGSAVFLLPDKQSAVCGTVKAAPSKGMKLFSSDWQEVQSTTKTKKGTRLYMSLSETRDAYFDTSKTVLDCETIGAFAINVEPLFNYPHPKFPFVGTGLPDPFNNDDVVPVIVYEAQPGVPYQIGTVGLKWIVLRGLVDAHSIVSFNEADLHCMVDFSNTDSMAAEVVHDKSAFSLKFI